jgi:DNA polymerase III alpha subunit (gram-positive type)
MLNNAPIEEEVYYCFSSFIKSVLEGKAVIVAHNASFDMNFLSNTLDRLGINGKLYYIDTLDLARQYLSLPNNKQTTVANYFNIPLGNAHRAGDDALVCGKILVEIVRLLNKN